MSAISTSLPAFERLRSVAERVWERIDRSMLRLQGRLDTPSYDRWLPYGFAIVQITVVLALALTAWCVHMMLMLAAQAHSGPGVHVAGGVYYALL